MQNAVNDANPRRTFFRWMVRQGLLAFEEMRGRPQMRLSDLPDLPLAEIAAMQPAVLADVTIFTTGDFVFARLTGAVDAIALFSISSPELTIFNRFNGMNTLAHVAADWSNESGRPAEEAFLDVRNLFLRMTHLGVCAPVYAADDHSALPGTVTQHEREPISALRTSGPVAAQFGEEETE